MKNTLSLNTESLLGFRLMPAQSNDSAEHMNASQKLGGKLGGKTGKKPGIQLGAKLGAKPGVKAP